MTLEEMRNEIDIIDKELRDLFQRRMKISDSIAVLKAESGDSIYKPEREKEIIEKQSVLVDESIRDEYRMFVRRIIGISRMYQYKKMVELGKEEPGSSFDLADGNVTVVFDKDETQTFVKCIDILSDYGIDIMDLRLESLKDGKTKCIIKTGNVTGLSDLNRKALIKQLVSEFEVK